MFEGMIIKTFTETDVSAYARMIRDSGYKPIIRSDYIRVGAKLDNGKIDTKMLGNLIYTKRKAKKLKRDDLSKMICIRTETIFNWELGRTMPQKSVLEDLMNILDITEGEIKECRM